MVHDYHGGEGTACEGNHLVDLVVAVRSRHNDLFANYAYSQVAFVQLGMVH